MASQCRALSLYNQTTEEATDWARRLNADYETESIFGKSDPETGVHEREGVDPDHLDADTTQMLERAERARKSWNLPAECPHECYNEDVEVCIFHLSEQQRDRMGVTPEEVENEFLSQLSDSDDRNTNNRKQFVWAHIPRFDLRYKLVDSFDKQPIDIRFSEIDVLRLDDAIFNERVRFDWSTIHSVSCRNTQFADGVSFSHAQLNGDPATFRKSEFGDDANFEEARFETGQLRFDEAEFLGEANLSGATVAVDLEAARKRKRSGGPRVDVSFQKTVFHQDAVFKHFLVRGFNDDDSSTVEIQVYFRRCRSAGRELNFKNAQFGQRDSNALFGGSQSPSIGIDAVSFRGTDFAGTNVNFTSTKVEGDLDFGNASLTEGRTEFNSMVVNGELSIAETDFSGGEVIFNDLKVTEAADFTRTKFNRNAVIKFHDTSFGDDLTFEKASMAEGDIDFSELTTGAHANFKDIRLSGEELIFNDANIGGDLLFDNAQFDVREADFKRTEVTGMTSFSYLSFQGKVLNLANTTFVGPVTIDNAVLNADSFDVSNATFSSRVTVADADLFGDVSFSEVEFHDHPVSFRSVDAQDATLDFDSTTIIVETDPSESSQSKRQVIDFTNATVPAGRFTQPQSSRTFYDFTRATIGDVTLRFSGDKDHGEALFEYYRFRETEFDGFDFSDSEYRRNLKANSWQLHTFTTDSESPERERSGLSRLRSLARKYMQLILEGPNPDFAPDVMESTYRKARIGADREGDSEAASKFFQKELGYRRHGHGYYTWSRGGQGNDGQGDGGNRLKRAWLWLTNATLWLISGYGERPKRVVLASLATIMMFTLTYEVTWWGLGLTPPATVRGIGGSLLLSAEMFTAIILGGGEVSNSVVRAISYIEGFIGSLFIALFVLTITRAIRR